MNKILVTYLILIFLFLSQQSHATSDDIDINRKNYQDLVDAFVDKDYKKVKKLGGKLKGYILYPYVEYYLVSDLTLANKPKVDQYLNKYRNKAIAVRLKSKWLNYLIANKHYHTASKYQAPRYAYTTRCNILNAKIKLGKVVNYMNNKDLWLHGTSRPDACNPIFSYWKRNNSIGIHNYSLRTLKALKVNNLSFAKKLALKSNKQVQAKVYLATMRRRALFKAKDFPTNGYQLLNRLPKSVVNDEVRGWKARQFIFNGNWQKLLNEINKMPKSQRKLDIWQYWRARSFAKLGYRNKAIAIYRNLARYANYYGFLSADRLSLPYQICNVNHSVDEKRLLAKFKPLKLALELYKNGSRHFANMEWNSAARRMNRKQKIDAAKFANKNGWVSRTIFTLGKLKEFHYYKMRFPLKWQKVIENQAKKYKMSPAYIYGIMRTESLMKPNAKSSVGALGLMQLMPKTAELVSRVYKLRKNSINDLFIPKNNIAFGSAYLDRMAKNWDNQLILMTASYNAGPVKVKEWVKRSPAVADRFIESIPYNETRKYVARVLDYTTMYNWVLYKQAKRIGYRVSNINDDKPFIPSKNKYTSVVCDG